MGWGVENVLDPFLLALVVALSSSPSPPPHMNTRVRTVSHVWTQ